MEKTLGKTRGSGASSNIPAGRGSVNATPVRGERPPAGCYDRPVTHSRALVATLALAVVGTACDVGEWLWAGGVRNFREVSAAEGRKLAAEPAAHLIQVQRATEHAALVPGAWLLSPDEAPPPELGEVTAPVVVLAAENGEGYRLAARLVRAGIQGVAVVDGGLDAWEIEAARATAGEAPGAGG